MSLWAEERAILLGETLLPWTRLLDCVVEIPKSNGLFLNWQRQVPRIIGAPSGALD